MIELVRLGWVLLAVYLTAGGLFCVAFQLRGLAKVDPAARGIGVGFRLMISPGVTALWPWVAWRWVRAKRGRAQDPAVDSVRTPRRLRTVHSLLWKVLAILVPVGLGVALWFRPAENHLPSSKLPYSQSGPPPAATAPR